jgi:hypothetical protein
VVDRPEQKDGILKVGILVCSSVGFSKGTVVATRRGKEMGPQSKALRFTPDNSTSAS